MKSKNEQRDVLYRKSLSIKAVGDIAPGDSSISGLGICALTKRYGCDFLFQEMRQKLGNSDLLIANLEGVISQRSLTNDLRLCGLPGMARALRRLGFDVLSLANNHAFDHGPDILKETILHCENVGIKVCGLLGASDYYSQPLIIEKNLVTVGILAYNWIGLENAGDIGKYIATVEDGIVNYSWKRDSAKDRKARTIIKEKNKHVISDLRKLRDDVDILILMPHWGYEWTIYPPYGVVLEARSFIQAGADLIIGSHPHIPQGLETYNNGLIIYSLGNFLFDSVSDKFKYGMMLECEISPGSIDNYSLHFVKRDDKFRPEPVSDEEAAENMLIINKSSRAITSDRAEQLLDDDLIYHEFERQYNNLKYQKVIFLLKNLLRHPFLIKPTFDKILNFIYLIVLRVKGKKIRW